MKTTSRRQTDRNCLSTSEKKIKTHKKTSVACLCGDEDKTVWDKVAATICRRRSVACTYSVVEEYQYQYRTRWPEGVS